MRYRIGLDIGTSSLGLVAYEINDNSEIIDLKYLDEIIFGEPIDPKKMKTLNTQRRDQRLARRQNPRKKARLLKILHLAKLLDVSIEDIKAIRHQNIFQLRVNSLYEKVSLPELVRIFLHIAKHRGYKGDLSDGTIKKKIATANSLIGEKTISETWLDRQKAAKLTGEPWVKLSGDDGTFLYREDVIKEFKKIIAKQKEFHPELSKLITINNSSFFNESFSKGKDCELSLLFENAIFYQRPIKWALETIGNCALDKRFKRASCGQLAYQKYRIAKVLSDLRIKDKKQNFSSNNRKLSVEEMNTLFNYICENYDTYSATTNLISFSTLYSQINLDKKLFSFNLEDCEGVNRNGIKGLSTVRVMSNCGVLQEWNKLSEKSQEIVIEFLSNITKFIDIQDNPDSYVKESINRLTAEITHRSEEDLNASFNFVMHLKENNIFMESEFKLENKRASYSVETLRNLTKNLLDGKIEYDIIEEFYNKNIEQRSTLRPAKDIAINHPIIDRALVKIEKSINYAVKKMGCNPIEIVLELSRDMKKSLQDRSDINNMNNQTNTYRTKIMKELTALGVVTSAGNIEKMILFKELELHNKNACPYCGETININDVFSPKTQVDHIIPQGGGGANVFSNKILCCSKCNGEKGKRTPFLWSQDSNARIKFNEVTKKFALSLKKQRSAPNAYHNINVLKRKSSNLLTELSLEELNEDFCNRQNQQTAWIGKIVLDWLGDICPNVSPSYGQLTAYIRKQTGLEYIIPKIRIAENKDIYTEDGKKIDKELWHKIFVSNLSYNYLQEKFDNENTEKVRAILANEFEDFKIKLDLTPNQVATDDKIFELFIKYMRTKAEYKYYKRCDHRHHIIDAAVIGLCSRSVMQRANEFTSLYGDLQIFNRRTGENQKFNLAGVTPHNLKKELERRLYNYTVWHKPDHYPAGIFFDETAYNVKEINGIKRLISRKNVADILAKKTNEAKEYINLCVVGEKIKQALLDAVDSKSTKVIYNKREVKKVKVMYKIASLVEAKETNVYAIKKANVINDAMPHIKYYQYQSYAYADFDKQNGKLIKLVNLFDYLNMKDKSIPENVIRIFINDTIYDTKLKQFFVVKQFNINKGIRYREVTLASTDGNTLTSRNNLKGLLLISSKQDILRIRQKK